MTKTLLLILLVAASPVGLAQTVDEHQHHQHPATEQSSWPAGAGPEQLLEARFELINGSNETVTEQGYRGRYLLIGFGFSRCKHVCPTILSDWAQMMNELPDAKARQLQPLMITLDPERDSPEHMDQYAKLFNPGFQGLSGSADQIARTAENFRVTYQKVPIGDDYQINHTSMTYLVDPRGQVIDYFGFGTPSLQLAERIAGYIP